MENFIKIFFVITTLWICCFGQDTIDEEYGPCNQLQASECLLQAIDIAEASGCNSKTVMDEFPACITYNTALCHIDVVDEFQAYIDALNITVMNAAAFCGGNCTDETAQELEVGKCMAQNGGLVPLSEIINLMWPNTPLPMRMQLRDMILCMTLNAQDCPALLNQVREIIVSNPEVLQAATRVGATIPLPATTLRPIPTMNIKPDDPVDTGDGTGDGTGNGTGDETGDNPEETSSKGIPLYVIILLSIAGAMLLFALLFGAAYCIEKRKKDSLLGGSDEYDSSSMASTSAKSYFRPPRYYFSNGGRF